MSLAFGLQDGGHGQAPADGAPPDTERVLELERIVSELRAIRAAANDSRLAAEREIDEAHGAIRRLDRELEELELRRAELVSEVEAVTADVDRLRSEREDQASALYVLGAAVDAASEHAHAFVTDGPMFQRGERLALLPASGEPPTDGLERYLHFLADELQLARSSETYAADIPLGDGRVKPARVVRVGHLLQAFITEDGEEVGVETAAGWEVLEPGPTRQSVIDALDTLDGRRVPELIDLPLRGRLAK